MPDATQTGINTSFILLLVLLVLLSGMVAYVGDRLGVVIGKKRLSLFGARPKRTGQIIGVSAGILIMLMTFGIISIVQRGTVRTILNAQRTYNELTQARADYQVQLSLTKNLGDEIAAQQTELATAIAAADIAKTREQEAISSRDEANAELEATRSLLGTLEQDKQNLLDDVAGLNEEITSLESSLRSARADVKNTQVALSTINLDLNLATSQRDEAQVEAKNATAEAEAAQEKVNLLSVRIDTINAELADARDNLLELETELEAKNADLEQASLDLTAAQTAEAEATASREAAVRAQTDAEAEARSLAVTKSELEGQVAALIEQASTTQNQLTASQNDLADLKDQFASAQTQFDKVNAQLEEANTSLEAAQTAQAAAEGQRLAAEQEATRLASERTRLEAELAGLQASIDPLQQQNAELTNQNEGLTSTNASLLEDTARLEDRTKELEAIESTLQKRIETQNAELKTLESNVQTLTASLNKQAEELSALQRTYTETVQGKLTYRIGETIHTGIIRSDDPNEARAELSLFIQAANNKVAARGAEQLIIETDTYEALLEDIVQTPGENIVTLRSPDNQFSTSSVEVRAESIANERILSKGQLVAHKQIHLGTLVATPIDAIRRDLSILVSDANDELLFKGLTDGVYAEGLNPEDFKLQLLRQSGPVTIGVIATEDIYRGGPAKLELIILN